MRFDETEQAKTPLLTALLEHVQRGLLPFHMPAHKAGRGTAALLTQALGAGTLPLDLTEVPGLDDLHRPAGAIAQAQALAANAFGSEESFFLVNGSTGGLQAALLACLQPGDAVLLPRDAHRSVLGGLILAGARPVFMPPRYESFWGFPLGVTAAEVARGLAANPRLRAILLLSPNYHGVVPDIKEIVALAHQYGLPVIVDEAHGAHFPFHPELPMSAVAAGADVVVHGLHKVGGSLTQSALLHRQGQLVDPDRLKRTLTLLQSTSPSYLLMVSLDAARMFLATEGRARWGQAIHLAEGIRERLASLKGLSCLTPGEVRSQGPFQLDPTRLTITGRELGLTGLELADRLRRGFGIEVEMSDSYNLVALVTPGDDESTMGRLTGALEAIAGERRGMDLPQSGFSGEPPANFSETTFSLAELADPPVAMTPREAHFSPSRKVPLPEAPGRIAAGFIAPYPPGIPLIYPGEVFTQKLVDFLTAVRGQGLRYHGMYGEEEGQVEILGDR